MSSVIGHSRRGPLLAVAAAIGVATALGAAACGSSNQTGNTPTSGQAAGAAPSGAPGNDDAFRQCLQAHGVPVPSDRPSRRPRPSGSPRPRPSGAQPGGPGGMNPSGIPAACQSLRPDRAGG